MSSNGYTDLHFFDARGIAMVGNIYWGHESVNYNFVFVIIAIDYLLSILFVVNESKCFKMLKNMGDLLEAYSK